MDFQNEIFQRIPYKDHDEWLNLRGMGIGGSDAASIIGMNPYKSIIDLWEEKLNFKQAEDISDKPCVKYGNEAEDLIRKLFALDHPQYEVQNNKQILVSEMYDFMRASLDGELIERISGRKGILEIKTTEILKSTHKEKWNNKIPNNYYCQLLHYFLVTGYDFAVLVVEMKQVHDGQPVVTRKTYFFEKVDLLEDIKYLKEKEIQFWNDNIIGKRKPNQIINL